MSGQLVLASRRFDNLAVRRGGLLKHEVAHLAAPRPAGAYLGPNAVDHFANRSTRAAVVYLTSASVLFGAWWAIRVELAVLHLAEPLAVRLPHHLADRVLHLDVADGSGGDR